MYTSSPRFQPFSFHPRSPPGAPCRAATVPAHSPLSDPADTSSLRSTPSHRFWTFAGAASVSLSIHHSVSLAVAAHDVLSPLLAALAGYSFADLGSGVYHWLVDNYGDTSTPLLGSQIAAFQGHHKYPSTITRREPCNNLHALARAVAFALAAAEAATAGSDSAAVHAFVSSSALFILLSQQFHSWAHEKPRRLPPGVGALQQAGVLVSRAAHAAHHRAPYNGNYCIVSGMWNGVLDRSKAFEVMEMVIFFRFRLRPRSWSEPAPAWAEHAGEGPDGEMDMLRQGDS